jgi:hypothetical protein
MPFPVLYVPLGTLIKTQREASSKAFQNLFNDLKLGIKIDDAFLQTLTILFDDFNAGKYSLSETEGKPGSFALALLGILENLIPSDSNTVDNWRESFLSNWQRCWDAMCKIDVNTMSLLHVFSKTQEVVFVVYGETNESHLLAINKQLRYFNKFALPIWETTYEHRTNHEGLVQYILDPKTLHGSQAMIIVGNIGTSANKYDQMAKERVSLVKSIAKANGVAIFELNDRVMSPNELQQAIDRLITINKTKDLNTEKPLDLPFLPSESSTSAESEKAEDEDEDEILDLEAARISPRPT